MLLTKMSNKSRLEGSGEGTRVNREIKEMSKKGATRDECCFRRRVGQGSERHCLQDRDEIADVTSLTERTPRSL